MSVSDDFADLALDLIADGMWSHQVTFTYGPRQVQAAIWAKSTGPTAVLSGGDSDVAGDGFAGDGFTDGAVLSDGGIDSVTVKASASRRTGRVNDVGEIRDFWSLLVPSGLLSTAPSTEDSVTIDNVERSILDVQPVEAEDNTHFYRVLAER